VVALRGEVGDAWMALSAPPLTTARSSPPGSHPRHRHRMCTPVATLHALSHRQCRGREAWPPWSARTSRRGRRRLLLPHLGRGTRLRPLALFPGKRLLKAQYSQSRGHHSAEACLTNERRRPGYAARLLDPTLRRRCFFADWDWTPAQISGLMHLGCTRRRRLV